MTDEELEKEEEKVSDGINHLLGKASRLEEEFYSNLDSLLKKQDRKTCAEIDAANCGYTRADLRARDAARLAFNRELLAFMALYFPELKRSNELARIKAALAGVL